MNTDHRASPPRGFGRIVALLGLLTLGGSACNSRFAFDTTSTAGGTAGTAPEAGATSLAGTQATAGSQSGAAAGGNRGAGGSGGASGNGGAGDGGSAGGGAAGTAGTGGADACGTRSTCPAPLHCADGECVQCAQDADCASYDLARCEPMKHRCVACMEVKDCKPGFTCDPLAHHCLQSCQDDVVGSCPPSAHGCDEQRSVCYQCDADLECAKSSIGPLCAVDGSGCVQCKSDTDCTNLHCDPFTARCVQCRSARDCPDSGACDPRTGTCLPP